MEFSYNELAKLNQIVSIALLSGKIELDDTTKTIHEKVANEIQKMTSGKSSAFGHQTLTDIVSQD